MAIQVGVSLINRNNSQKSLNEIKKIQQKARIAAQNNLLERDYQKFQRACEYQYKIEEESHEERLKAIECDFLTSFGKMAHNANLSLHYPLNISPYIISRSVIPVNGAQIGHFREEVFCVLTNSNDKVFNKEVVPYIDSTLCNLIASYWNEDSLHTICYFSNTWNERISFCDEDIDNLKSTIVTPTIAVSPYFERNEDGQYVLVVKLNMWGVGSEISCQVPTDLQFSTIPIKYSTKQIDDIIVKLVPRMIGALAPAIDVYYWETYHLLPLLPSLISKGKIFLDDTTRISLKESYVALYNTFVLGRVDNEIRNNTETSLVSDVALINQCNNPSNNIKFLEDLLILIDSSLETETLIRNSFVHLYESRTGEKFISFTSVKAYLLQKNDMDLIRILILLAKQNQNHCLVKELVSVVKNKIQYWL